MEHPKYRSATYPLPWYRSERCNYHLVSNVLDRECRKQYINGGCETKHNILVKKDGWPLVYTSGCLESFNMFSIRQWKMKTNWMSDTFVGLNQIYACNVSMDPYTDTEMIWCNSRLFLLSHMLISKYDYLHVHCRLRRKYSIQRPFHLLFMESLCSRTVVLPSCKVCKFSNNIRG